MSKKNLLVRDYMTSDLMTLTQDDSITKALETFESKVFRHIPVIDKNKHLVGILSDRDVRSAMVALDFLREAFQQSSPNIVIKDVMTLTPKTLASNDSLEKAAMLMINLTIGAVPVVDEDDLKGIITYTDILRAFIAE